MTKFVVTTRKEVLESLKKEGYKIVGVDGTVPGAEHLYDYSFDHHRQCGADIQLDEMLDGSEHLVGKIDPIIYDEHFLIVTTQVDADAIVAAYRIAQWDEFDYYNLQGVGSWHLRGSQDNFQFLRAISYDCDHLCVPNELNRFADDAAMVVAALKEEGNKVAQELELPTNRREWSIEDKEKYSSLCFERGVQRIDDLLEGKWDYRKIARPYWEKVKSNMEIIQNENRIEEYKGCLIFHQAGMEGYIDPRCWIRNIENYPEYPITVTQREVWVNNEFQGYSYTLGTVPLHPKQKEWDYTKGVFNALTEAERKNNPEADGWGGRATVGGSGWNTPSTLSSKEVIDVVLATSEI